MSRKGILYIISAPSGAGKTSICSRIMDLAPNLRQSISFTTRPMRAGEQDGVDYHFVSQLVFDQMVCDNAFIEWARVHDNCYGTARRTVDEALQAGCDVLLDIDIQGAAQLRRQGLEAVFIFILPPSMAELRSRLVGRNTDAPEVVERRIGNAVTEIAEAPKFDYLVVNDDLERAIELVRSIMTAETAKTARAVPQLPDEFGLSG